jgi:hypothetical protein
MAGINPLTASNDISLVSLGQNDSVDNKSQQSPFGEFSQDIVSISKLARQQQQTEQNTEANINAIARDAVRVTSTIGQAKASGNLTQAQAEALYKKIAALL